MQGAVGVDARAEAGGKAGRGVKLRDLAGRSDGADEHAVEVLEDDGGVVRELIAQRADQGAGIHGGLQAFAADVADNDKQ